MSLPFYSALIEHFEPLEQTLNQLDAATGDGDHGTTMLKGLRAIVAQSDAAEPAKSFRRAAGGASGSLFSILIKALDQVLLQNGSLTDALQEAAAKITQIGQAVAGDKTMLDALLAAAAEQSPTAAAEAAQQGAESTKPMSAKRGRARYVENAGIGHIDAGAVSVAHMLTVFAEHHAALQASNDASQQRGDSTRQTSRS